MNDGVYRASNQYTHHVKFTYRHTVGIEDKVHVCHRLPRVQKAAYHLHEWLNNELKTGDSVQCAKEQDRDGSEGERDKETPPILCALVYI